MLICVWLNQNTSKHVLVVKKLMWLISQMFVTMQKEVAEYPQAKICEIIIIYVRSSLDKIYLNNC